MFTSLLWSLLVGLVLVPIPTGASTPEEPVKEVQLTARRFSFRPAKIRMDSGQTLELTLKSQDVIHGFRIIDTDIDVRIPARGKGPVKVRFVPSGPGKYRFVCSHQCGAGHAQMRGVIEVRPGKPASAPERKDEE